MIRAIILFFLIGLISPLAGQSNESKLTITPLTGDFYIYTTYNTYQDFLIPAHGMYLITDVGVILFDTPWDTTQFQPLLDSIKTRHDADVELCIATHWHEDRTEGLEYYKQKGIDTYTTFMTDRLCKVHGMKRAKFIMTGDTIFNVGSYSFEIFYPGEGHTADNIIIWFEKERILYGGCLIKGADADNLGNMTDANPMAYEFTLRNVKKKCKNPRYILVSHSDWNDNSSLKHSIKLARKLRKDSEIKR